MLKSYLDNISLPNPHSHKGQNGKVLVIGGSKLFHSSIFWSAQVASKFVDIVHFSSPANENNRLVREKLKAGFWQGIVVDWQNIDDYLKEDDAILIGPGMERGLKTKETIDDLLSSSQRKKWVIDGGALQEVNIGLLQKRHIITPHKEELKLILTKLGVDAKQFRLIDGWQVNFEFKKQLQAWLKPLLNKGVTILAKGVVDVIFSQDQIEIVKGGNAGLTKGGSGDILAGLVVAFYAQYDAMTASVLASMTLKNSAGTLWQKVGPNFNAEDLIAQIPKTFWSQLSSI